MKEKADVYTVDLVKPRRGRPPNPFAKTQAQRQADYRARLKEKGKEEIKVIISEDIRVALDKYVEFKDMTLGEAVDRILRDRLLRKR